MALAVSKSVNTNIESMSVTTQLIVYPVNQRYFFVRDTTNVIAIHKIYDSAIAVFEKHIKDDNFTQYIDLIMYSVSEYGEVYNETVLRSYTREHGCVICHTEYKSHTI